MVQVGELLAAAPHKRSRSSGAALPLPCASTAFVA